MSTLTDKWRNRRRVARGNRDFERAINQASSPALRDELLTLATRNNRLFH